MLNLKSVDSIPGDMGLPILGEALEQFQKHQMFFLDKFQHYGPMFRTKVLYMNAICLAEATANQLVLRDKADCFSNEEGWIFLKPFFGGGLFTQDGLVHARAKKIMLPAFHAKIVESYFNLIKKLTNAYLKEQINQKPVVALNFFRKLTLDTMIHLVFGELVEKEEANLSQLFLELNDGIQTIIRIDISITRYGRALAARRKLEKYILQKIYERKFSENKEYADILSLLINATDENYDRLSDEEIVSQVLQILFGGFETTAELLTWCLFSLEKHSIWRQFLEDEQVQINQKDTFQVSSLKTMNKLSYFLKEVERLYPPVYAYPRKVIKEFEYKGYLIPKGWFVFLSPLITHRLSELFDNPEQFDPLRFAPPREEHKRHPFALVGFGAGAHKCLGYELATMELKIILSLLLKTNWKITSDLRNFSLLPNNKNLKKLRFMITD